MQGSSQNQDHTDDATLLVHTANVHTAKGTGKRVRIERNRCSGIQTAADWQQGFVVQRSGTPADSAQPARSWGVLCQAPQQGRLSWTAQEDLLSFGADPSLWCLQLSESLLVMSSTGKECRLPKGGLRVVNVPP